MGLTAKWALPITQDLMVELAFKGDRQPGTQDIRNLQRVLDLMFEFASEPDLAPHVASDVSVRPVDGRGE